MRRRAYQEGYRAATVDLIRALGVDGVQLRRSSPEFLALYLDLLARAYRVD